jgi:hypothetical protein
MIALIDGDIVLYRSSASCEPTKAKPFLEEEWVATERLKELMARILLETKADDYTVYIGSGSNFRYSIYPDYKSNRTSPKPTHYAELRRYLLDNYKVEVAENMEADDLLCINQYKHGDESIICSIDKDLLQIPGKHYNFVKNVFSYVSPLEGLQNFYKQLIAGDGTDNIPSYDGKIRHSIPKFISDLCAPIDGMFKEEEMYNYCLDVYVNDDTLHRNAQLLYTLRNENETWRPPPNMNRGLTEDTMLSLSVSYDQEADDIPPNMSV